MGKAYTAVDGDLSGIYMNPATTATINGVEVAGSYASPYYVAQEAYYQSFGAGLRVHKYLNVSALYHHFDLSDGPWAEIPVDFKYYFTNLTLNLSSEPIKNWYFGLNINHFKYVFGQMQDNCIYFDLGAIKKFELGGKDFQTLKLAAAVSNFNFAKVKDQDGNYVLDETLPVIARLGSEYKTILFKDNLIKKLNTLTFQLAADYKFGLNTNKYRSINAGADYTFLDILSARIGFYNERLVNSSEANVAFPFGYGLQIPFDNLTKIPLVIAFDYTNAPQPVADNYPFTRENFNSYTFRVVWKFTGKS
jgi:hypothetical protein